MLDSSSIVSLYDNVLHNDIRQYNISIDAIRIGIESMREVYKPTSLKSDRSTVADYNDVAHRCAYLHKYASLHTAMVRDMMYEAIQSNFGFFYHLVSDSSCFKICSLGGGPGTDIIGVLAALHSAYSYFTTSVTVVDYMVDWRYSFNSILNELGSGLYGAFGNNTSFRLNWRYVGANLLKYFKPEVAHEISSASLVTMVKFASAAACKDTEFMIKNIFTAMKPGAVLFFIDNDGGGFRELIMKAAYEFNFISIFGPYRHENYKNEIMRIKRFGFISCHKTTVSVHILQKPPVVPRMSITSSFCNPQVESPRRTVILGSPFINERPALLNHPPVYSLPYGKFDRPPPYGEIGCMSPYGEMNHPPPYERDDFSKAENFNNDYNNFSSSLRNIPQSPFIYGHNSPMATPINRDVFNSPLNIENIQPPIFSPYSTPRRRRSGAKRGCFPLSRINNLRHRLTRKLDRVKSKARTVFQKSKKEKSHTNSKT